MRTRFAIGRLFTDGEEMLEYREFPKRTAANYLVYSPFMAYCIYVISSLSKGTFASTITVDNALYLGLGFGLASITLLIIGQIIDRTRLVPYLLIAGALLPTLMGFYRYFAVAMGTITPDIE
ncbi:MAG: hypothetical protein EAX95_13220, partial [Candidatus Thorarchaeota archaeon]|nr:hypothetical protein [Candidatus Thorarchaeota archaeon]